MLRISLTAVAVSVAFFSAQAATTTFTDSTFNLADYTVTSVFKSDPTNTVTYAQCATCGDPSQALQITMTFPQSGGGSSALGFVNTTFSYDPSTQGAISSIGAFVNKDVTLDSTSSGFTNTFRPLIEQDGNFYLATIPGPHFTGPTTGYLSLSNSSLVASDFVQYDFSTGTFGTANPNFGGDPMLLGLGQITTSFGDFHQFEADYDNLTLSIHSTPDSGSTFLLMFIPVAVLLAATRQTILGTRLDPI